MTKQEKSEKIKSLVTDMLNESNQAMIKKIDKALNCGAIDIENWDGVINKMILPKTILIALLEDEVLKYSPRNTSFEKQMKKDIKNLKYFL